MFSSTAEVHGTVCMAGDRLPRGGGGGNHLYMVKIQSGKEPRGIIEKCSIRVLEDSPQQGGGGGGQSVGTCINVTDM